LHRLGNALADGSVVHCDGTYQRRVGHVRVEPGERELVHVDV
jgi:hypothetical protein